MNWGNLFCPMKLISEETGKTMNWGETYFGPQIKKRKLVE